VPELVEHTAAELLAWQRPGGPWLARFGDGAVVLGGRVVDLATGDLRAEAGGDVDHPVSIFAPPSGGDLLLRSREDTGAYGEDLVPRWTAPTGGCCNYAAAMTSIDRHTARGYYGSINGGLYEIDLASGTTLRTGAIGSPVWTALDGDRAYNHGNDGGVTRIDTGTLAPLWTLTVAGTAQLSQGAITADGSLVVSTGGNRPFKDFDLRTTPGGRLVRVTPDGSIAFDTPGDTVGSPVVGENGLLYTGFQPGPLDPAATVGGVAAYDATGALVWSTDLGSSPLDLFVGDDDRIYVTTGNARLQALDAETGEVELIVHDLPAIGGWMILAAGVVVTSGGVALELPPGFAHDYDPLSPWPVWRHDNRRTANARD
jgi:hypothetical protein